MPIRFRIKRLNHLAISAGFDASNSNKSFWINTYCRNKKTAELNMFRKIILHVILIHEDIVQRTHILKTWIKVYFIGVSKWALWTGFAPLREYPIRFRVYRLNHTTCLPALTLLILINLYDKYVLKKQKTAELNMCRKIIFHVSLKT